MSVFIHTYECTTCGEVYHRYHADEFLYVDECPACGTVDNEPEMIVEAPYNVDA